MTPSREEACPQEWVAGFCFNGGCVALIRKARPEWQRGKLNGVGGKIEPGETPEQAMRREWVEETGTKSPPDWRTFCVYDWKGGRVHFMVAFGKVEGEFRTDTDEAVCWRDFFSMLGPERTIIPNLRWLLPLALDKDATMTHAKEPDAWNTRATPTPAGMLEQMAACWKKAAKSWRRDFFAASRGIKKLLIENSALKELGAVAELPPLPSRYTQFDRGAFIENPEGDVYRAGDIEEYFKALRAQQEASRQQGEGEK